MLLIIEEEGRGCRICQDTPEIRKAFEVAHKASKELDAQWREVLGERENHEASDEERLEFEQTRGAKNCRKAMKPAEDAWENATWIGHEFPEDSAIAPVNITGLVTYYHYS